MTSQSAAIIFRFYQPVDFYDILDTIEQHPGVEKVIYKKISKEHRLYIVDESELERRAMNDYKN